MSWTERLDREIKRRLPELRLACDEPMSRHTSFRTGGPARRMAFPTESDRLALLLELSEECGARPLVIGRGSNLLAPDEGVDRLVITTLELSRICAEGETGLTAEAGTPLAKLAEFAARRELTGLEFAHGIPGTVGGALCMNAGAYGGEMSRVVSAAELWFSGRGLCALPVKELRLSYRHSLLTERPDAAALSVTFRLERGDGEAIREKMRQLMSRRKASQPLEYPSAGSTFKRPEGHFAGALIEQCGLKGLTVGGAQVSEKHAGFLINTGAATSRDILTLIEEVQRRVLKETGVLLEPEVQIIT